MSQLTTQGTTFLLEGKPFEYTGLSFFNAIFNPSFTDSAQRKQWLAKFLRYGLNVLRLWGQWDNQRGFVDSGPAASLYELDGTLRPEPLERLKAILRDVEEAGMVVELAMFARESWEDGIRLTPEGYTKAATALARELAPFGNLTLQIWNEHDHRAVELAKVVKSADPRRLVSNSPGYAGVLGSDEHNRVMDYLSPHTSRQYAGPTWEIAPQELSLLLARYRKPVVDDEPARNGTPQFGGPKEATHPYDHILHTYHVWQVGAYVTYHHDMFQLGYGSPTCPPSGVPDPEFSPYHRQVLEFIAQREKYRPRQSR